MKLLVAALLSTTLAVPALAQTAPGRQPLPASGTEAPAAGAPVQPAVGVTVVDTAGAPVGTIESIADGSAVINTGTNKAPYPLSSMTPGPKGPIIAMTKVQLDGFYAEQAAKAATAMQEKLVAGAAVKTRNGAAQAGTVKSATAENVVLTTAAGRDVQLPRTAFSIDAQGGLIIGFTAEEFAQAVGATQ